MRGCTTLGVQPTGLRGRLLRERHGIKPNRAVDILRRERTACTYAPELEHLLSLEGALSSTVSRLFLEPELRNEQLRLMFSCCHARIAEETQVALILNILCGFSVREVASAFLIPEATLEKRLQRIRPTSTVGRRADPGVTGSPISWQPA